MSAPTEPTRRQILEALQLAGGNRTKAAELLQIGRATLYRWMERYGLLHEAGREIAGRYQILRLLGEGTQGSVFLVKDTAPGAAGAERALKLLRAPRQSSADLERLRREYRTLALMRHPGLVRVLDFGEDQTSNQPFLAMEVVPGEPFVAAARGQRPVWVLRAAGRVLEALDALHRHGLIHRDVKSENVLVDVGTDPERPSQVTLMDLGLTEDLAGPDQPAGGTLLYTAPEVLTGGRASVRTDLYAVGVLLYAALTQRLPVEGGAVPALLEGKRAEEIQPPSVLRPELNPGIDRLAQRLLAADPEGRYADARGVIEEIDRLTGDARGPAGLVNTLVGRETELEKIIAALERPSSEACPAAVLLFGEPGIGKSRLAEGVVDEMRARGWRVGRGVCRSGGQAALEPMGEALETLLPSSSQRLADEAKWGPHHRTMAWAFPGLLPGKEGEGSPERTDLPKGRPEALLALGELVEAVLEGRPTLLVFEDLHEIDPFLLDLVWLLARRGARLPLRLLLTSRPPEAFPHLAGAVRAAAAEQLVTELPLGPLGKEGVRRIAADFFGPARAALLTEALLRATGGNPLHLQVLLRDVEAGQVDLELSRAPSSLLQAVRALVEREAGPSRRLMEALAIAGRPASAVELAAITSSPEPAVGAALEGLARRQVLVVRGGEFDFAHAHVRDAVNERLAAADRALLHGAWAKLLEADPLRRIERAGHLLAEGEWPDRHAEFEAAAAELERAWQPDRAFPFLEAAIRTLPSEDRGRLALFERLNRAAVAMANPQRGIAACREWADLAHRLGDLVSESRAVGLLAARHRDLWQFDEARVTAEQAVQLAEQSGQPRPRALAEKILATVLWSAWDHQGAAFHIDRAVELFLEAGDLRWYALCLQDTGMPRAVTGRIREALEGLKECRRRLQTLGDPEWTAWSLMTEGLVLLMAGDLVGAEERLRQNMRELKAYREDLSLDLPLENLALLLLRMGRFTEALTTAQRLVEEATHSGHNGRRVAGLLLSGEALFQLDERDAARDHHRLALELADAYGEESQLQFARLAIARDLRTDQRWGAAEEEARRAWDSSSRRSNLRLMALSAMELARLALDRRKNIEALEWLDQAAAALRVPREDGAAHLAALHYERARFWQAEGQPKLALAEVHEAIGLTRRSGPRELEIRLLSLAVGLFDSLGDEVRAARKLSQAAIAIEQLAAGLDDPRRRARFLGRPDISAIRDAARRRVSETPNVSGDGRRSAEALARLYEVGRAIAEEGDLDPLFQRVVQLAVEQAGAERGLLLLRRPESGELEAVAGSGVEQETTQDVIRVSRSVLERANAGQAILTHDASSSPEFQDCASVVRFGIRSVMCVPLRLGNEVLGMLYVDTRGSSAFFSVTDLRFLEALADQAAVALSYGRLVGRLSLEKEQYRRAAERTHAFGNLIGRSAAMRKVFDLLEKVAPTELSVLVHGESGTGKELVARALHLNSPRREQPFLSENCAALPEPLLESLLFGHAKGAFTGADSARRGLFAQADGGTLFLDEVGDMSPALQAKLLRVLQEREFRPLGSELAVKTDVRVIAATHRDLEGMVAEGLFRQDLFFRLNGVSILLPPLRERKEDIPALVDHFLARENRPPGGEPWRVEPAVMRALVAHSWPGNVRELENTIRRMCVFSEDGRIGPEVLQAEPALTPWGREGRRTAPSAPKTGGVTEVPAEPAAALREALARTGGDKDQAAALLGISRATLYRRLAQYGITAPRLGGPGST